MECDVFGGMNLEWHLRNFCNFFGFFFQINFGNKRKCKAEIPNTICELSSQFFFKSCISRSLRGCNVKKNRFCDQFQVF